MRPESETEPAGDRVVRITLAVGLAALLARALPAIVQTFWIDETATWWLIDGGWTELVARWRQWPYQSLAHGAVALAARQILGASEWAVRLPSLLAALAALALLYRLAHRLVGPPGAAAAVLALLGHPTFYFALTQARPYGLGLLALLVSWSALCLWTRPGGKPRLEVWATASAAAVYFHPTLALGLAAQLPWLVARWRTADARERRSTALATVAALLACLPLADSLRATAESTERIAMPWGALSASEFGLPLLLVVAVAVACAAWPATGVVVAAPEALRVVAPLWLLPFAVTVAAHRLGIATLDQNRYQLAGHVGLALATGLTVGALPARGARRAAVAALALAAPFTAVTSYWPRYDGADWRAASRASARLLAPGDLVITPSPFVESNDASAFGELERPGRLSANLVAYPLGGESLVLPFRIDRRTGQYVQRRFAELRVAERDRLVLLCYADQREWLTWLQRQLPRFDVQGSRQFGRLAWIELAKPASFPPPAASR